MKNACKQFALCTLTLILCLALAACGSDNSGDSADYGNDSTVPSTIDGFVKESYDSYDYSAFEGYYLPDSGTDFDYLIIDTNGSRWRIGSNDDLSASGYLQYDADYDCIYAYNDSSGGLWGLYERAPGAEATEVDGGFISAPTDVDDVYYAVSTTYQDVTYEFTLFDTDSIVWGGENDYYERLE